MRGQQEREMHINMMNRRKTPENGMPRTVTRTTQHQKGRDIHKKGLSEIIIPKTTSSVNSNNGGI